jgi:hypothetical protein
MPSTDRSAREAIISCGALLDHLRVAMAAAGWKAHVDRFPNPNNLDHLASIDFTPMKLVTEAHRRRADAILIRRTDRLPFAAPTEWESFEPLLRLAFDTDAVGLDVMSDDVREELEEMSKLTDSLRLYDSAYNSELSWWTAPFEFSEGIPYSALVSADEIERVDFGRTFPLPRHRERRAEVPGDHSKILALSTYGDSRKDALICGEVLSAVLLECTTAGLGTCTVTHITELRSTRELVAAVIGQDAVSQVLIRVGSRRPRTTHRRHRVDLSTTYCGSAADGAGLTRLLERRAVQPRHPHPPAANAASTAADPHSPVPLRPATTSGETR